MRRIGLALAGVAVLGPAMAGCQVGPDFTAPAAPIVAAYTPSPLPAVTASAETPGGQAQRIDQGGAVSGRWWTLYGSAELNALVEQALKANPDLQAAQAALRGAREAYYAQRGALRPTVDAGYSATRQRVSAVEASPLDSDADLFSLHTAQLTVGYTPDVFGGLRRQAETAQAQAEAQRFQTEAVFLTLTANLVAAAIQGASLAEQIAGTKATIAAEAEALDLMRRQWRAGEIARPDVAAQQTLLAQAEQTLPPLEKQLAQQNDLVAVLSGRFSGDAKPLAIDLASLTLPSELPVSLPSRLVEQRPDIRAAAASLHAASAQVGVALAARLPTFPISIGAGSQSTDLGGLLRGPNAFWTLTGGITQPLYDGGALKHRALGAQAGLDQAKAQYQSTVLTAFQNVADVLQALDADARTLAAAAAADRSASESLALAQQLYKGGQAASLGVLSAQQARQQALVTLTQARAARYADTAALFQALGGGWWNRPQDADLGGGLAQAGSGVVPAGR